MTDIDRRLETLERWAEGARVPVTECFTLTDDERLSWLGEQVEAGKLTRTPDGEWEATDARIARVAEILNNAERRRNDDTTRL